jgi:hypothetical protein
LVYVTSEASLSANINPLLSIIHTSDLFVHNIKKGKTVAHFCCHVRVRVQDMLTNFNLFKNHKIANNSKPLKLEKK